MNYFYSPYTTINHFQPYLLNCYQIPFYQINYYPQTLNTEMLNTCNQFFKIVPQNPQNFGNDEPSKISFQKEQNLQNQTIKTAPLQNKDENQSSREQDKSRNIYSNILKRFFSELCEKRSMDKFILEDLKLILNEENTNSVVSKIKKLFITDKKTYFSPKTIRQILFSLQPNDEVRKILTKCLCRFLKDWFPQILLLSSRIKKKSKILQMRKSRQLLKIMRGQKIYQEQFESSQKNIQEDFE